MLGTCALSESASALGSGGGAESWPLFLRCLPGGADRGPVARAESSTCFMNVTQLPGPPNPFLPSFLLRPPPGASTLHSKASAQFYGPTQLSVSGLNVSLGLCMSGRRGFIRFLLPQEAHCAADCVCVCGCVWGAPPWDRIPDPLPFTGASFPPGAL